MNKGQKKCILFLGVFDNSFDTFLEDKAFCINHNELISFEFFESYSCQEGI